MSKITIRQREYLRQRLDSIKSRFMAKRNPSRIEPRKITITANDLIPPGEIIAKFLTSISVQGTSMVTFDSVFSAAGKERFKLAYEEDRSERKLLQEEYNSSYDSSCDKIDKLMDEVMLGDYTPDQLVEKISSLEAELLPNKTNDSKEKN